MHGPCSSPCMRTVAKFQSKARRRGRGAPSSSRVARRICTMQATSQRRQQRGLLPSRLLDGMPHAARRQGRGARRERERERERERGKRACRAPSRTTVHACSCMVHACMHCAHGWGGRTLGRASSVRGGASCGGSVAARCELAVRRCGGAAVGWLARQLGSWGAAPALGAVLQ